MIMPWLKGFLDFEQVPLTWTLVGLNILVFLMTHSTAQKERPVHLLKSPELELTAVLYAQYQKQGLPPKDQFQILALRAMQDSQFIRIADQLSYVGDQIAISDWKVEIRKFRESIDREMTAKMGLNRLGQFDLSWITYQFMHVGLIHLIGNMGMLLIFAAAVEQSVGGLALVLLYLIGGLAAGFGFLHLSQPSLAPMVGASGALSALIAFYAVVESKKRVRFFYFFSPFKGYYGWIYLPVLLILPLSFANDLAAFIATSDLPTGVANTAHLGGAIFGVLIGLVWRILRSQNWRTA